MDEYTPKRYDIAQLRFLSESLYDEGLAALSGSHHGWVNDPTSASNLQLNELIEHIAFFLMNFKIKHPNVNHLSDLIEEYLDDTYTLFSNYGISNTDLCRWKKTQERLFTMFSGEYICTAMRT